MPFLQHLQIFSGLPRRSLDWMRGAQRNMICERISRPGDTVRPKGRAKGRYVNLRGEALRCVRLSLSLLP